MAPQVCAGRYTPEDFGVRESDQDADVGTDVDGSHARTDMVVETTAVVTSEPVPPAAAGAAGTEPAGTEPARTEPSEAAPALVTDAQRKRIEQLYELLAVPHETREAALKKRGVNSLRSLTASQAAEIVAKLEAARQKLDLDAEVRSRQLTGPATAEQVAEIKQTLLPQLSQTHPDLYRRLVAKMKADGRKFADLTFEQAHSLIEQIKLRNLEAFFSQSLASQETSKN